MKNEVLWGVIGSGGIARRRTIPEGIIPAKNARLITVFDINQEVNEAVASQFNAIASHTIEELLLSEIDAVYIATPVNMHLGQVILSAKAGKHIFCEKPLGLTIQEAEGMGAICKKEGLFLGTAFFASPTTAQRISWSYMVPKAASLPRVLLDRILQAR